MPIISFANPKGGTGKSTSALVLALEMAHRGGKVALVDCDPNQVTAGWAQAREAAGLDIPFEAIANPGEDKIIDVLDELAASYPFVIVDLEGTASLMMSRTMSRSDLTVIPMQASPVDAKQAARVPILEIPLHERAAFRAIFTYNKTLRELTAKESAGLPKAKENAEGYAYYVVKNAEGYAYYVVKALKDEFAPADQQDEQLSSDENKTATKSAAA